LCQVSQLAELFLCSWRSPFFAKGKAAFAFFRQHHSAEAWGIAKITAAGKKRLLSILARDPCSPNPWAARCANVCRNARRRISTKNKKDGFKQIKRSALSASGRLFQPLRKLKCKFRVNSEQSVNKNYVNFNKNYEKLDVPKNELF